MIAKIKYLFTVFLILFFQTIFAEEIKYIDSDKLKIVGGTAKSNPKLWLKSYGKPDRTFKRDVRITALFDIENVKEIIIHDYNAMYESCQVPYPKHLATLFFDPEKNIKEIGLFIHFPCFVGLEAIFKLVATKKNNKHYINIISVNAYGEVPK